MKPFRKLELKWDTARGVFLAFVDGEEYAIDPEQLFGWSFNELAARTQTLNLEHIALEHDLTETKEMVKTVQRRIRALEVVSPQRPRWWKWSR